MPRKKLLLVGWDSADWKIIHPLLDAGALPGVARLVESGVSGNLTTLEPQLSPMLWTSIATGKMAYHHGVPGFTEVDPRSGAVVPVSAATRTCRTLWEMLGERGLRSHVVSWFATQGEQHLDGKMVSNMFCHLSSTQKDQDPSEWPAPPPGTYWPPELSETMDDLRVSPHEIDPDEVIRLFVPNASEVDQTKDKRLWMLAQKLVEHIHLPLQSGSDRILKIMRRGYTAEKFQKLAERIRAARPGMAITSDIIVGFPGETDEDFQKTRDLCEAVSFDNAFVFRYSPRQNTPAATMEAQISEELKEARNQELLEVVNRHVAAKLDALVGTEVEILCEGASRHNAERLSGRTRTNKIVVFEGAPRHIGQIFPVKITRASGSTLYGDPAILE